MPGYTRMAVKGDSEDAADEQCLNANALIRTS